MQIRAHSAQHCSAVPDYEFQYSNY